MKSRIFKNLWDYVLNSPKGVFYLTMVLNVIAIFAVQLTFEDLVMGRYFNSDALNLPSIYQDIFVNGNSIAGWHLTEAPYIFPDMLLYFLLMFITGGNFLVATLLYSLIQFVVLSMLFQSLLSFVLQDKAYPVLILCQVIFSFAIFSVTANLYHFDITLHTLLNGYHLGAGLMALLSMNLTLRFFEYNKNQFLWLIGVLNIVMVISDLLYLLYYLLPSLLLIGFVRTEMLRHSVPKVLVTNVLSLVIGLGLKKIIFSSGIVQMRDREFLDASNILPSFSQTWDTFYGLIAGGGSRAVFISIVLIATVCAAFGFFKFLKRYSENRHSTILYRAILCLFITSVMAASILAPAIKGFVFDSSSIRYYMFSFFLAATGIFVPYLFITQNSQKWMIYFFRLGQVGCLALLGSVIFLTVDYSLFNTYTNFFNYKPAVAEEVDRHADEFGLKLGIANFWDAKVITMFSEKGVQAISVHDQLTPYIHAASEQWYYSSDSEKPPVIDFVFTEGMLDHSYLNEVFSEDEIHRIEGSSIVIIPESYYERQPYAPPIPVTD